MESKRITKNMVYTDIIALLRGEKTAHGTDVDAAVTFIEKQMEMLARKNASKASKPTATQTANEAYKVDILKFLQTPVVNDDGEKVLRKVTCTEISKGVKSLEGQNNQKIAALMGQLVSSGYVTKETVKGKSLFSAVDMEEEGE